GRSRETTVTPSPLVGFLVAGGFLELGADGFEALVESVGLFGELGEFGFARGGGELFGSGGESEDLRGDVGSVGLGAFFLAVAVLAQDEGVDALDVGRERAHGGHELAEA